MSRHLAVEHDLHLDPRPGPDRPLAVASDGVPMLGADEARELLHSMAAMTRVIFGVALQSPAGQPAPPAPAVSRAPVAPRTPVALAPEPAPVPPIPAPTSLAVPDDPPALTVLAPVAGPPGPAPASLPLPPDDQDLRAPRSPAQNLGLLQEIAFLDD